MTTSITTREPLHLTAENVESVFARSSVSKFDLSMANAVGVIDAGYRGEITVKFKPGFRWDGKPASGKHIYNPSKQLTTQWQITLKPESVSTKCARTER